MMTKAKKGYDNTPTLAAVHNLEEMCKNLLQPLKDNVSFKLLSAFRNYRYNAVEGGKPGSVDTMGWGVYIMPSSGKVEDLYKTIIQLTAELDLKFDEIKIENFKNKKCIHIQYKNPVGIQRMIVEK